MVALVGAAPVCPGIWVGNGRASLHGITRRAQRPELPPHRRFLRLGSVPLPTAYVASAGAALAALCLGVLSGCFALLAEHGRSLAAFPALDDLHADRRHGD